MYNSNFSTPRFSGRENPSTRISQRGRHHRPNPCPHGNDTRPPGGVKREPRNSPLLSKQEMTERRASNRCFRCNEVGHWERSCPKGQVVSGSGNKPPGKSGGGKSSEVQHFGMTIVPEDDPSEEVLDSMPLGFVELRPSGSVLDPDHIWEVDEPEWMRDNGRRPRSQIGDAYALVAQYVLTQMQPYPEDERLWFKAVTMDLYLRFHVFRHPRRRGTYQIIDYLTGFEVSVPETLLKNSKFDLARWYAKRCAKHYSRRLSTWSSPFEFRMNDALVTVAWHLLLDGVPSSYPDVDSGRKGDTRFLVKPQAGSDGTVYEIQDFNLLLGCTLPRFVLEDSEFNLIGWYRGHLDRIGVLNVALEESADRLQERMNNLAKPDEPFSLNGTNNNDDNELGPFLGAVLVQSGEVSTLSSRKRSSEWENMSVNLAATSSDASIPMNIDELEGNSMPELQSVTTDNDSVFFEGSSSLDGRDFEPIHFENGTPNRQESVESSSVSIRSIPPDLEELVEVEDDVSSDYALRNDTWIDPASWDDLDVFQLGRVGDTLACRLREVLRECQPFPGDELVGREPLGKRFHVRRDEDNFYEVYDAHRGFEAWVHESRVKNERFPIAQWYAEQCAKDAGYAHPDKIAMDWVCDRTRSPTTTGTCLQRRVRNLLEVGAPYEFEDKGSPQEFSRFIVERDVEDPTSLIIHDNYRKTSSFLPLALLDDPTFNVIEWYQFRLAQFELDNFDFLPERPPRRKAKQFDDAIAEVAANESRWAKVREYIKGLLHRTSTDILTVNLNAVQVDRNRFAALQRNASTVKDKARILPKPLVLKCLINGHIVRALVDSGSQGDFIASTLVDQLSLHKEELLEPVKVQLAVQGSRSVIKYRVATRFQYEKIDETRHFDVINLNNYDLILGTPWLFQHKVCIGFNPGRCGVGSIQALPLERSPGTKPLVNAIRIEQAEIERARDELLEYASPLCREEDNTELPPLRAINHTIPLIDETRVYPWRPSRCPEAFRQQWAAKRDAYLRSGRWEITSAGNTVPMLLIPKPSKDGGPPKLQTVIDLRERNKNTQKLTSPLPDMEGMLRRAAGKPFRTALDLKNAYEQIRIIPEHVPRTAVTTPDGNMVSHVLQMGDCNAPATYQTLMNYMFSPYIGRFLDVYLDDIVVYDDNLEEHVTHVKLVLDVLSREKFYLSRDKLRFIEPELKLLGRVIDNQGIRMDQDKVDAVLNWKTPTNRDLLRGFLGSVGYLADDIPGVRIPMGILSSITGDAVPFRWTPTEQRAFEDVKRLVHSAREHRRVPLDYAEGAPTIWMITDGCATGISGVISQGDDWKTAKVSSFYSAKLNPAQQNYPVHEIEMLAGIETMLRYQDVLQGVHFKWLTDHKGLTHLLNQKNLSGRQARWLEKISSFDFEVVYITGSENVLADSLSRLYSNESGQAPRARSEYTYHDVVDDDLEVEIVRPSIAAIETRAAARRRMVESGAPPPTGSSVPSGQRKEGGRVDEKSKSKAKSRNRTVKRPKDSMTTEPMETIPQPEEPVSGPENNDEPRELPSLVSQLTSNAEGLDFLAEIRGSFASDTFFAKIINSPKEYRNFEVEDGLVYLKEKERRVLCIPKILIKGRNTREIVISEAHSMLAHLGASKTLDYLRDHVWWKDMVSDTQAFCETCSTCRRSKPSNQKPYGLLNPLPVPGTPWESIGVDFVGPLPESSNRNGSFDSIAVIICLLTGMVHLVPTRTNYTARQMAELMFEEVYKHHGLPKNIISDRDVLFTSVFWNHLHRMLGTSLKMSSAYHPQTDGSTERANRTVTQMLRQCINEKQDDWVAKLPAIEFAINSARSESTGFAPFFLNSGRMPRSLIWDSAPRTEFPAIRNFALQKKLALMSAHDSILAARVKQTRDANRKRQECPFKEGDLVYLSTKNLTFPKGLARKLVPKFIGPYKIVRDFKNSTFQLDLPSNLKRRGMHNAFHASLLRIHHANDDRLFPGRLDTQLGIGEDSTGEWAVEKILSHYGSHEDALFEIKWTAGDITWLPYYQISSIHALRIYLEALGVSDISNLPKGSGNPPRDNPNIFLGTLAFAPKIPESDGKKGEEAFRRTSPPCPGPSPSFSARVRCLLRPLTACLPFMAPSHGRHQRLSHHSHGSDVEDEKPTPIKTGHPNFRQYGNYYLVTDTTNDPPSTHTVLRGELEEALLYNAAMRYRPELAQTCIRSSGYVIISKAYNDRAPDGTRFSVVHTDNHVRAVDLQPRKVLSPTEDEWDGSAVQVRTDSHVL
ncbi:hypothetical protein NLJ89_g10053 [Agrocybe chaxingu]|uniref:RNA-directed DNA polymerase n=1 Tax=Agrocybe chaxingu TaxID=84603 RepID=A0A9W8JSE1_9AGAR|nr:hypothetical protein NLJ89_g10053 [Agrocybe chaxingu]